MEQHPWLLPKLAVEQSIAVVPLQASLSQASLQSLLWLQHSSGNFAITVSANILERIQAACLARAQSGSHFTHLHL